MKDNNEDNDRPPRELNLNIRQLRTDAIIEGFNSLLPWFRAVIKRLDDIDALERMLNDQAPTVAPTPSVRANGSTTPHFKPDPFGPPKKETRGRKPGKQTHSRGLKPGHMSRAKISAAMLKLLANAGTPLPTDAIKIRLSAIGGYSMATFSFALRQLQDTGVIRRSGSPMKYMYALSGKTSATPKQKPKSQTGIGDAILKLLGRQHEPMSIPDIVSRLKSGEFQFSPKNPPNVQVSWSLKNLIEKQLAMRIDDDNGRRFLALPAEAEPTLTVVSVNDVSPVDDVANEAAPDENVSE